MRTRIRYDKILRATSVIEVRLAWDGVRALPVASCEFSVCEENARDAKNGRHRKQWGLTG